MVLFKDGFAPKFLAIGLVFSIEFLIIARQDAQKHSTCYLDFALGRM
jgi:hypothetical protein